MELHRVLKKGDDNFFFLCRGPTFPPVGRQGQDAKDPDLRAAAIAALEALSRFYLPHTPEEKMWKR